MYCYILDDSTTPAYARAVFMRLDKIEQSLETIKSILTRDMRSDDPEIEVFSRPLKTPAELEELSEKLMDRSHRKKVVCENTMLLYWFVCVCVCPRQPTFITDKLGRKIGPEPRKSSLTFHANKLKNTTKTNRNATMNVICSLVEVCTLLSTL